MPHTPILADQVAGAAWGLGWFWCLASLATVAALTGLAGVFAKAGEPAWAAFLPIYNFLVLLRLTARPWWWLVLLLVPLANLVLLLQLCADLAKSFGRRSSLAWGLLLLPMFFLPWLGFGTAVYQRIEVGSDLPFYVVLGTIGAVYVVLIVLLLAADVAYTSSSEILAALGKPEIRNSIRLSLISCTLSAILSVLVAVPIAYLLSRHSFPGHHLIDAILDIPIVLPPLVVGLSLLILFQFAPRSLREEVVYQVPAVVLAQFAVACAFAVRTLRATFDQIDDRREQVALTLGCSRVQAFGMVVLPEAQRGILTAGTLAWARSLGEFGPLLVFAGATRNKTEVLSTTVFLELSIGNLEAAVAVSLIMVVAAVIVLIVARLWGTRDLTL